MNKVILSGRQTADARVSYTAEGLCVARFNLAVNRRGKDEADFPSCIAFGKTGEFVEKYGAKGKAWIAEGRIQTGSYEKDGARVYTTDVIVDNIEFGESKSAEGAKPTANPADLDEFINIDDSISEELPFH